VTVKNSLYNK